MVNMGQKEMTTSLDEDELDEIQEHVFADEEEVAVESEWDFF